MNHAAHIVIIGSGAAGLTCAETLARKGYTNVTILERSDHAGGKCSSIEYDGRIYELGAGILSSANTTALEIAQRHHVPSVPVEFAPSLYVNPATGKPLPPQSWGKKMTLVWQVATTYRRLVKKYSRTAQPGLSQTPPELCVPFSEFAKQHGIENVATELAPFFTGFGYDYFERIPAAYVLKYYSWATIKAFARRRMYKFPGGIQHLWTAVARAHTVVYNARITHIARSPQKICITTESQTFTCDALIVTTPLDEFVQYSDASAEEKRLFSQIDYCDYRTYAIFLKNFPQNSGYLPGNYSLNRIGHPVFWYQRYSNSPLYTFYLFGDWKLSDEEALHNITTVVTQLGGSIDRVHTTANWKYFPHVSPDVMRTGYFDAIEKLQGTHGTYYAGELLNFSTVGLTAEYAENLIERFF